MLSAAQLRLQIGDDAWNAIPAAPTYRPVTPRLPRQRRPRLEARHRLALSGYVPAIIGCGFTAGETAVLAIIAIEHKRHGYCALTIGELGRAANACRTLVHNAIRQAERWGIIKVERRKVTRDRNLPNRVTIINPTWLAWLRLGPSRPRPWGGGHQEGEGTLSRTQRLSLQKDLRKKESFDEVRAAKSRVDVT
jgi:hypothetical protein